MFFTYVRLTFYGLKWKKYMWKFHREIIGKAFVYSLFFVYGKEENSTGNQEVYAWYGKEICRRDDKNKRVYKIKIKSYKKIKQKNIFYVIYSSD